MALWRVIFYALFKLAAKIENQSISTTGQLKSSSSAGLATTGYDLPDFLALGQSMLKRCMGSFSFNAVS